MLPSGIPSGKNLTDKAGKYYWRTGMGSTRYKGNFIFSYQPLLANATKHSHSTSISVFWSEVINYMSLKINWNKSRSPVKLKNKFQPIMIKKYKPN